MRKLILGDVLEHIYFDDMVNVQFYDTRLSAPVRHEIGPHVRIVTEDILNDFVDPYTISVNNLDTCDGMIVITTDFEPFAKWVDFEESKRRAKGK